MLGFDQQPDRRGGFDPCRHYVQTFSTTPECQCIILSCSPASQAVPHVSDREPKGTSIILSDLLYGSWTGRTAAFQVHLEAARGSHNLGDRLASRGKRSDGIGKPR